VSETWQPVRGVLIVAGMPPGGGFDYVARAAAGMLSGRSAGL
jgi:tripartite-type tricarboxylate transporter receptor subunit TctC